QNMLYRENITVNVHRRVEVALRKTVRSRRGVGRIAVLLTMGLLLAGSPSSAAPRQPAGEMRWALYVKRLVFKSVPEAATRLAMLKKGEVDIAYLLDAPMAEELKQDPKFKLAFSGGIGIFFLDFFDQWDPKSPWHDKRVRLAANYAIDRQTLNEAETL